MWRDRLVIYLEKQIYRHRVFPNGVGSLLSSLMDDTFEGALLLSSVFKCGWLASDFIDDFPSFDSPICCTVQKPKAAWGGAWVWQGREYGSGVSSSGIRGGRATSPGDQWGVWSTVVSITGEPSPDLNKADPLLIFHRLLLRLGEWNISLVLGCFTSLWKSWKRVMARSKSDRTWRQWHWAVGWAVDDDREEEGLSPGKR